MTEKLQRLCIYNVPCSLFFSAVDSLSTLCWKQRHARIITIVQDSGSLIQFWTRTIKRNSACMERDENPLLDGEATDVDG